MATIAQGGLFPPIIDAYMPAFNIRDIIRPADDTTTLDIKYNTSQYNNLEDIKSVHVSIVRQSNYMSLLDDTDYPRGVYVQNHEPATEDDIIGIPNTCLNYKQLSYNEYYKVQVRLSKIACPSTSLTGQALSNYLIDEENLQYFSEWSTVCLIRFIAKPIFNIDANGEPLTNGDNVIDTSSLKISGNYTKGNVPNNNNIWNLAAVEDGSVDLEYLNSYNIKLYDIDTNELVYQTTELNVDRNNPNSFQYTLPYFFEDGSNFRIVFHFTTANLYETDVSYNIRAAYSKSSWNDQTDIAEILGLDSVIGKVNITFESQEEGGSLPEDGVLNIRRSDNNSNFTIWENIWKKTIPANTTILSFDDFTIESGTLYKYEINYTDTNGDDYFIVEGPVLSVFNDAFLTGEGTQLSVKFNPSISSFKYNVGDALQNTIGGKYPYITRNGAMEYRTFSLSGTIAYEMDNEHQFASRSDIYGEWIDVYGSYFVNHYINQQNDRLTQRKFRELVMDYLYSDNPKLFRSTPEGNVLVRLTNVNLTPNQQLSRMIYDFSCDVTEIGEASIDNYKLYNIQDFGEI